MNRIIQFHLKIKACDPAWRWMIENRDKSSRGLWEDCSYGHWLVDYLRKIYVPSDYIKNSCCQCLHSLRIYKSGLRKHHAAMHNLIDQIEAEGKFYSHHIESLSRRKPTFYNMIGVLVDSIGDMQSNYPEIWDYISKNPEPFKDLSDTVFAEAIRARVPYDLVVAQREKMGG